MLSLPSKICFLAKRPAVIIISGNNCLCAKEAVFQALSPFLRVKKIKKRPSLSDVFDNEVLIFSSKTEDDSNFRFFLQNSRQPILVLTHVGEIPHDVYFFGGEIEKVEKSAKLAGGLGIHDFLISNFDDETTREVGERSEAQHLTFGFQKGADFLATDIRVDNNATNFKINYQGNIVPLWLKGLFGKEQIYVALLAMAVGSRFNLNLVELSQALKNYHSLPGKMRMIDGVNDSLILDDSENSSPFSMVEALRVLSKIKTKGRKIAVLGDILGLGKYSTGAHEDIGAKIKGSADLLFTYGLRAKFLAKGAEGKSFDKKNIFEFTDKNELLVALKAEIRKDDLILVDGSEEMDMGKVVDEIKK